MTARIIDPQVKIQKAFDKFAKKKYKGKAFAQFQAAEEFFQDYYNTDLRLNDFKNMIGYIKNAVDKYEYVGKQVRPESGQKCNYYKQKNRSNYDSE